MDAVTSQLVMGIIPTVIGIGLIYWINRRKFYRRNGMGAEGFSSFEAPVFIRFIERVGKWIAYILIILGVVTIWSYTQMKKTKEKQEIKTEQIAPSK
ncbi:molybdenum ABC transporter permease [Elizabethkingia meningoseptica]|uniref:molybdenum ABC transporter permease n=1 Tax=Elizabethkingia meningoseptica TaxID=238 RepID=UPI00099B06CE|nr:molybdenum ABC transporter permease [Elizabethkingia meningoseptica]OPC21538.1 molybdenum ABC transporter permease [Elizabethkingia meningoseptica]